MRAVEHSSIRRAWPLLPVAVVLLSSCSVVDVGATPPDFVKVVPARLPLPRRPPKPPAAWHPDPWGAARLRWWDGEGWSADVHA